MQVDAKVSFIHLVLPFLTVEDRFGDCLKALDSASWSGAKSPLQVWKRQPLHVGDLLAHVGEHLNCEDDSKATAAFWRMEPGTLQSLHGLGSSAQWTMKREASTSNDRQFSIDDLRLALFRTGVGFLTLRIKSSSSDLDAWLDLAHYLRFFGGQRGVSVGARRKTGKDEYGPFFPVPAGGMEEHPEGTGPLGDILEALLATGPQGRWWREVFVPGQALVYHALFVDGLPENRQFELLYRVRNFFDLRREICPSEEDLSPSHPSLLCYAARQWFTFALEGGGFVAFDAPETDFFRNQLPSHLDGSYYLLYILASHQRFALMKVTEEITRDWLGDGSTRRLEERERAFDRIRDSFLAFASRGYFLQVMQHDHHHRCYRKWQEVLEVDRLYSLLMVQVKDMHEHLVRMRSALMQALAEQQKVLQEAEARLDAERERKSEARSKQLERRVSKIGVYVGVPALAIGFFNINIFGYTTKEEGLTILQALLVSLTGLAAAWILLRFHEWSAGGRDGEE